MLFDKNGHFMRLSLLAAGIIFLNGCELVDVSGTRIASSNCSATGVCGGSVSGGGSSGSSGSSGGSSSSPFGLSIVSYWDTDNSKLYPRQETQLYHVKKDPTSGEYLNTGTEADLDKTDPCNIKAETDLDSLPEDRHRTCGLLIPETRLYFSRLEFTLNIASDSGCEVVYFTPVSYRVSNLKDFQSLWSPSKLDCSNNESTPVGCFSGPGIKITGFPQKTSLVQQLTNNTIANTFKWTADSAFENTRGDNRWSAYYPFSPALGPTWKFECVNEGSNQNFKYNFRIIPTRDPGDDVGENWDRYLGWVDENGVYNGNGF